MKPKLAIVNIYQLGYHTDTYNYCKYLINDFNITYISFHQGFENIVIEGVDTFYIPHRKGFWNLIKGYIQFAKLLRQHKPDITFLFYARFISIVKIFFEYAILSSKKIYSQEMGKANIHLFQRVIYEFFWQIPGVIHWNLLFVAHVSLDFFHQSKNRTAMPQCLAT